MHFNTLAIASLSVLGAFAAPAPHSDSTLPLGDSDQAFYSSSVPDFAAITTTTVSLTLTTTSTHTYTATGTAPASSTSSGAQSTPSTSYSLISSRSGSPVHFLPWNAAGFRFWLGGSTASYCPTFVNQTGSCPKGDATAFLGTCSMDVEVPGGQQIYVTPTGELGYTQAHSISVPAGARLCPFYYSKPTGSNVGYLTLDPKVAFGAGGFIACPTKTSSYQVFANLKNATVPLGKVSDCLTFDAIAGDYGNGFAAWQYI